MLKEDAMDKTTSLSEAISTHLHDGDTVALEGFGHLVPVAAAHEIIRQKFSNLTLARMSCDVIVDQLLGANCLTGLIAAFVANSSAGLALRTAPENRALGSGTAVVRRIQPRRNGGQVPGWCLEAPIPADRLLSGQ